MADPQGVELRTTLRAAGLTVVSAHGRLVPAAVPELFVTAVTAAGGWPIARLVLFGADAHSTERLQACRVPDSVPLARTVDEAASLVGTRRGQDADRRPRLQEDARG